MVHDNTINTIMPLNPFAAKKNRTAALERLLKYSHSSLALGCAFVYTAFSRSGVT